MRVLRFKNKLLAYYKVSVSKMQVLIQQLA